jgi:EAL domain-containing protein (putative c-di-GMP-specific phosphodiesterase class I)/GGDEF domain-containing protein
VDGVPGRDGRQFTQELRRVVAALHHAFQPIVNIGTGACVGYEALLRGYEAAGFPTIQAVFDRAAREKWLFGLDLWLRERALQRFRHLCGGSRILFYNLDRRAFEMPDYRSGETDRLLADVGLPNSAFCYELSERQDFRAHENIAQTLLQFARRGLRLALDDFGNEYSSLRLLYHTEPDFVKIDRFFISAIPRDHKKRLLVSTIVGIAHTMGALVIAEGVESEEELLICRDLGCDLVQGYLVQAPTTDAAALREHYPEVAASQVTRRDDHRDSTLLRQHMCGADRTPPIPVTSLMGLVFDRFCQEPERHSFAVVDEGHSPLGIVRELDLKSYVYSPFGRDLLQNPTHGRSLRDFICRAPIVDIGTPAAQLLEVFTTMTMGDSLIVTENLCYAGIVDATAILKIVQEKNLHFARDENPLTRMPGNAKIEERVEAALGCRGGFILAHFDFDNFKPFNDHYGFRRGDRVILLFATLMHKRFARRGEFIGHIGGDDFVVVFEEAPLDEAGVRCEEIRNSFAHDVQSFYNTDDRDRGFLLAQDREGTVRRHPLLTVSAALVVIPAGEPPEPDEVGHLAALLKMAAKRARCVVAASLVPPADPTPAPPAGRP